MWKAIVKGILSSERAWITLVGLAIAYLAKRGIVLPDGFADKATDLIMVLVASLGVRSPRPKAVAAKPADVVSLPTPPTAPAATPAGTAA